MIAPAPAIRNGDQVIIDGKFAQGMRFQSASFPGDFDCILRERKTAIPFHTEVHDPKEHGFGLTVLPEDGVVTEAHLQGYDLIFCSVDDERNLDIPAKARAVGAKLATTLEYTLATRLAVNALDPDKGALKRLKGALKLRWLERKRQRFLSQMDGIQANGYPALEICQKHDPNTLFFLDGRMTRPLYATPDDQAARRDNLLNGGPLRLMFSGRLETMKGAQHLVPIAKRLRDQNVPFMLEIFGTGALEHQIAAAIRDNGLDGDVVLKGPVDFETQLVPAFRTRGDIFLSCHMQDDPSCSFIEAMGCGLAVAGYENLMWQGLWAASQGGWTCPIGAQDRMADTLAGLHENRAEIVQASENALEFAGNHDFETMSRRRMDHLAGLVGHHD